ncbi:hypothetical protein CF160_15020 [Enterococcus pseudoavium]|nr:hypothetical protein CF160_15020 [Enterococcus pseudoavium]
MKKKLFRIMGILAISLCIILLLLSLIGTVAEATGLVDDTVKAGETAGGLGGQHFSGVMRRLRVWIFFQYFSSFSNEYTVK